jgi:NAD-dependent deacetylase
MSVVSGDDIQIVSRVLSRAKRILVITGAGISAESDIPTFRSEKGWWRSLDPEELATKQAFRRDPLKVCQWYDYRRGLIAKARPNAAHKALAAWEAQGKRVAIITQNVDDLHERAGSSDVIHLHGCIWQVKCEKDRTVREDRRVPLPELPPICDCGSLLRPNVVWFDERVPAAANRRVKEFFSAGAIDLALVIGTEATFDYIRKHARNAKKQGALLVEINLNTTPLTKSADVHLPGKAGEILPLLGRFAKKVKRKER